MREVGRDFAAADVALIDRCPEEASAGVYVEADGVAQAAGEDTSTSASSLNCIIEARRGSPSSQASQSEPMLTYILLSAPKTIVRVSWLTSFTETLTGTEGEFGDHFALACLPLRAGRGSRGSGR